MDISPNVGVSLQRTVLYNFHGLLVLHLYLLISNNPSVFIGAAVHVFLLHVSAVHGITVILGEEYSFIFLE